MENEAKIQSLERAFNIIEILSYSPQGMPLMDIVKKSGYSKSTVHRFLSSLGALGYIRQDKISKKYFLTLKMFEISGRIVDKLDVFDMAKEPLQKLQEFTGEAIHLVIRDNCDIVYIHKLESQNTTMRMFSSIGMRRPMYCTAVGKSILATLEKHEIKTVWENSNITKFTDHTIMDLNTLLKETENIKQAGYALDNEENELGVRCIAASIKDYTKKSSAAFSVSAPLSRMSDEKINEIIPIMLKTRDAISQAMGFRN